MNDDVILQIGHRLREERVRASMSQIELAAAAQVSRGSQIGYETGARPPDASYLLRISALGLDAIYVLYGERQERFADAIFDWDLYHRIQNEIEQWTIDLNIEVPLERRQVLAKIIYDGCRKRGEYDPEIVDLVLRAAA